MKAKELLRRYRTGERDFRRVDLSGESLRGINLTGINLSGANLNNTDLRGTNFTDTMLVGTQLCEAKTGTQRRWFISILLFSCLLSVIAAVLLGAGISFFLQQVVSPNSNNVLEDLVAGIVGLVVVSIALCFNYRRGILTTLGAGAIAGAMATAGAVVVTGAVTVAISAAVAVAVASAGAVAIASAGAGVSAAAAPRSFTIASTSSISVAGAVAVAIVVVGTGSNSLLIVGFTATVILSITISNIIISRRALSGDPRDQLIRDIAVGISCLGGTRFNNANLTNANFSQATLKSAHFKNAHLTHTCFHLAQKLHISRTYNTLLSNRTVLNLLVSLRPDLSKSYAGLNLTGANLDNAYLADLDLAEVDLSNATLQNANLQRTNLSKLQALGTNFQNANLTAACLESWNIDSTTQLDGAICEHV
ncbi:MAG: pentapeptide repeat-containing protein [Cyanobacteria bacterium P01_F01_bin.3]